MTDSQSQTEKKQVTVTSLLQEVADDICNHYCKYPEAILTEIPDIEDDDIREQALWDKYCHDCPLNKLA